MPITLLPVAGALVDGGSDPGRHQAAAVEELPRSVHAIRRGYGTLSARLASAGHRDSSVNCSARGCSRMEYEIGWTRRHPYSASSSGTLCLWRVNSSGKVRDMDYIAVLAGPACYAAAVVLRAGEDPGRRLGVCRGHRGAVQHRQRREGDRHPRVRRGVVCAQEGTPAAAQAAFLARIAFDAISGMIAFFALPAPREMKDEDETTTDEEEDDPGAGRVYEGEGAAAGPWRGEEGQG